MSSYPCFYYRILAFSLKSIHLGRLDPMIPEEDKVMSEIEKENSAAVEEVSAGAEEMSAQVEEVTASAQSLAEMAQTLQAVVAQFRRSDIAEVTTLLLNTTSNPKATSIISGNGRHHGHPSVN
jgi:hypothetical protein